MAKDIDEKIGARSQKNLYGLKYRNPLKNYRVHEMPTGDQLPPHYNTPRLEGNLSVCVGVKLLTLDDLLESRDLDKWSNKWII